MQRSAGRRWLLLALCGSLLTIAVAAGAASPQQQALQPQHAHTDCHGSASSFAAADTSNSRVQRRTLMQQQQQVDRLVAAASQLSSTGSSSSSREEQMKPLYEMARMASGPQQVVILDDSLLARSMPRLAGAAVTGDSSGAAVQEIVVYPAPSSGAPTTVSAVPSNAAQVFVPVSGVEGQVSQVAVISPPGQPALPITFVPTRPVTPMPQPPGNQGQPGPFCIPVNPTTGFNVLAAGDSITQGSVPSKNLNHPYTIALKEALEPQLQVSVRAVDAGLGGGGIFMTGFNVPVTFGPWLDTYLDQGPWNVVVIMIGINDLLRGGRAADDIMNGLVPLIQKVLATNTPVILIPPFAAPGFVQETDFKEAERKKLARLFQQYATTHAGRTAGMGPQVWMMDLQASAPFDFYPMPASERSKWLDDGLHMTELAYDTIGQLVAKEIQRRVCPTPVTRANQN